MLKQRVITALVLLAVLLPALFYRSPEPFFVLTLVFIGAAAWEWARLNGGSNVVAVLAGAGCVAVCLVLWRWDVLTRPLTGLWLTAGAAWVLLGGWALARGVALWGPMTPALRQGLGWLALCITWLALVQARLLGINFLLSTLALVWAADIGAYFSGRAFGGRWCRRKLAASISPGKSWEGVWGGMLAVILLALIWQWAEAGTGWSPSLYARLAQRGGFILLLACLFLVALSVVGDLFESLVKRSAGVKDSSGLLPGHGGVLDRVDALLPTLPLAMMLVTL